MKRDLNNQKQRKQQLRRRKNTETDTVCRAKGKTHTRTHTNIATVCVLSFVVIRINELCSQWIYSCDYIVLIRSKILSLSLSRYRMVMHPRPLLLALLPIVVAASVLFGCYFWAQLPHNT